MATGEGAMRLTTAANRGRPDKLARPWSRKAKMGRASALEPPVIAAPRQRARGPWQIVASCDRRGRARPRDRKRRARAPEGCSKNFIDRSRSGARVPFVCSPPPARPARRGQMRLQAIIQDKNMSHPIGFIVQGRDRGIAGKNGRECRPGKKRSAFYPTRLRCIDIRATGALRCLIRL
jgi:hypothetical protein